MSPGCEPGNTIACGWLAAARAPPDMPAMPAAQRKPSARTNARGPVERRARPPSQALSAAALDARLDLALVATFPASDPIAIGRSTALEPPSRPVERGPAGIDGELVERIRTPCRRARDT